MVGNPDFLLARFAILTLDCNTSAPILFSKACESTSSLPFLRAQLLNLLSAERRSFYL